MSTNGPTGTQLSAVLSPEGPTAGLVPSDTGAWKTEGVWLVDPADPDDVRDVLWRGDAPETVAGVFATAATTDRIAALDDPDVRARLADDCRVCLPPGDRDDEPGALAERAVSVLPHGLVQRVDPGGGTTTRRSAGDVVRLGPDARAVPLSNAASATGDGGMALDVRVRDPDVNAARPWNLLFPGADADASALDWNAAGRYNHLSARECTTEDCRERAWHTRVRFPAGADERPGYHASVVDARPADAPADLVTAGTTHAVLGTDDPEPSAVERLHEASVDAVTLPGRNGWTWCHLGSRGVVAEPERGPLAVPEPADRLVDELATDGTPAEGVVESDRNPNANARPSGQ